MEQLGLIQLVCKLHACGQVDKRATVQQSLALNSQLLALLHGKAISVFFRIRSFYHGQDSLAE